MATTYIHTRMGVIDANGDTNILYPQNTATDVSVSRASNSEIPSTVSTIQQLADSLAASAFAIPIDDTSTSSTTKSWSANKINSELTALNSNFTNNMIVSNKFITQDYSVTQRISYTFTKAGYFPITGFAYKGGGPNINAFIDTWNPSYGSISLRVQIEGENYGNDSKATVVWLKLAS